MVSDDTDGNVPCVLFVILLACQLTDTVAQRTDGIYVKNGIHVLNNHCQTFQTHTGINVFLF